VVAVILTLDALASPKNKIIKKISMRNGVPVPSVDKTGTHPHTPMMIGIWNFCNLKQMELL
jgi:hypothetical protein